MNDPNPDAHTKPLPLETMRKALLHCQLTSINHAINHSHILQRWKNVANLMIKKSGNRTKISRLQILHLHEANLNCVWAIKHRQLMHHSVNKNPIHPCQCGGISGRDSMAPVLMIELHNEITRLTKSIMTLDFDAASCHDRMMPSLASIISRGFGQHSKICFLHARHL